MVLLSVDGVSGIVICGSPFGVLVCASCAPLMVSGVAPALTALVCAVMFFSPVDAGLASMLSGLCEAGTK